MFSRHAIGLTLMLLALLPSPVIAEEEEVIWPVANGLRKPKEEPSAWQKMTTGTKKFFSSTGTALGLTKPEPQKKTSHYSPYSRTAKKAEKKSLWDSWFGPKDPPPPKSMSDFMKLDRPE